jgi:Rieske Fe-S protein
LAVAGALLGLGLSRRDAMALPVSLVRGVRAGPDHVTYPVPAADGTQIDHDNGVILVRWQGHLYAFNLACPHQNTALKWLSDEGQFQCPKHKSRYQPDGTFISGRATRGMDRFAITREGDNIVVELNDLFNQEKDRPGWDGATLPV